MSPTVVQPIALGVADMMVRLHHRHAGPATGHLYSLGLFADDWGLLGAVIVGRPVARHLDDGATVEVTRLVTLGARNACSTLYGAACREARRRGYRRVVTYTRSDEPGTSLRASGFVAVATTRGRQWDTPTRRRRRRPTVDRVRWERTL